MLIRHQEDLGLTRILTGISYLGEKLLEVLVSCCHVAIRPLLTIHNSYYLHIGK